MFVLKSEQEAINLWIKEQNCKVENHGGAIGGRYTYMYTPTSLGCIIKVRDNVTHEEKDFTDYGSW